MHYDLLLATTTHSPLLEKNHAKYYSTESASQTTHAPKAQSHDITSSNFSIKAPFDIFIVKKDSLIPGSMKVTAYSDPTRCDSGSRGCDH